MKRALLILVFMLVALYPQLVSAQCGCGSIRIFLRDESGEFLDKTAFDQIYYYARSSSATISYDDYGINYHTGFGAALMKIVMKRDGTRMILQIRHLTETPAFFDITFQPGIYEIDLEDKYDLSEFGESVEIDNQAYNCVIPFTKWTAIGEAERLKGYKKIKIEPRTDLNYQTSVPAYEEPSIPPAIEEYPVVEASEQEIKN